MARALGIVLGQVTAHPLISRELISAMTELPDNDPLFNKLNRETARIHWQELQRFYAQGAVLEVAPTLDLIAVAVAMADDDASQIQQYLGCGDLSRVGEVRAQQWLDAGQELWAVVVAPWVLVQTERGLN